MRGKDISCNNSPSVAMRVTTLLGLLECSINLDQTCNWFSVYWGILSLQGHMRLRNFSSCWGSWPLAFWQELCFVRLQGSFRRHRLVYCRDTINADDLFGWGQLALRLMPPGLAYWFTCLANGACAQSNRIPNLHLPSPGAYDDYDMVNICLFCRLDIELACFLEHFCFLYLDFLL